MIKFTCGVCNQHHLRTFTKDAYHKGVVIIRCEKCENFHLIADNLGIFIYISKKGWFHDEKTTIESIIRDKGGKVEKLITDEALQFIKKEDLTPEKNNEKLVIEDK